MTGRLVSLTLAAAAALAVVTAAPASAAAGPPAFIQGAARWSLEWGCGDGHDTPADFAAMRSWDQNTVSVTLSSRLWLDPAACPGYQATVRQAVANANAAGLYVILTLQWVNPQPWCPGPGGQYPMPDAAQAVPFWRQAGRMFAADPLAGFQLYSEPHDVSPAVWRWGGMVYQPPAADRCAGWYRAAGMQQLAGELGRVAPGRLVYVSGLGWAHDLSMVRGDPIAGPWVRYSVHLYPGPGWDSPAQWGPTFGFLGRRVVALEFGTQSGAACPSWPLLGMMRYLRAVTGGMVGWAWTVSGPCSELAGWGGRPTVYAQTIRRYYLGWIR